MNKIILVTVFLSFFSSFVFASTYPEIAGITISETTTAAEYIIYFFNLLVAIGAFIAVVMVIIAGIEWMTSSGDPGKVGAAKGKIMNTLLGVGILMGGYLILDTINDQLKVINIGDLYCEHGIVVLTKETPSAKSKQECIDRNQTEIKADIQSTKKWNFPAKYLLKVYTYSEANYKGTIKEFDCGDTVCEGDVAGAKSIYFVPNNPGIYLYDDVDYKPGTAKGYPFFTSTSITDLAKTNNFDNFTKSLAIINPPVEQKIAYQAVVFEDQNHQGRCAFVGASVPSMDQSSGPYYTDKVGNNSVSSVIVAKSIVDLATIGLERGEVIFYNKTNCGKILDGEEASDIKSCHIKITGSATGQVDFYSAEGCNRFPTPFDDNEEVMSFEITGSAGVVLSTSRKNEGNENTYCQYFNKASLGSGTCFSSILDSPIFTSGPAGKKPKSFIILPDN
ncbi:MAG: pilin [Candidatus Paceibacterota bacterium]|jgi:hypothetical protein